MSSWVQGKDRCPFPTTELIPWQEMQAEPQHPMRVQLRLFLLHPVGRPSASQGSAELGVLGVWAASHNLQTQEQVVKALTRSATQTSSN